VIIRAPRQSRFVIVGNDVALDRRLSYRARGILIAILARPDDWRTDSVSLARDGREGRDAIRSALQELEQAGYLTRRRAQDPDTGRWATAFYVYDTPQAEDGFPGVGNPDVGEPGAIPNNETKDCDQEVGSGDLDCESRSAGADANGSPTYSPSPRTAADQRDLDLLARYMTNTTEKAPALVYRWMRTGERPYGRHGQPPIRRPGAFAAKKHRKSTREQGVSEWQGYFRRQFSPEGAPLVTVQSDTSRAA
jgi:hypothetical protein